MAADVLRRLWASLRRLLLPTECGIPPRTLLLCAVQDVVLVGTPLSGRNATVAVVRRPLATCDVEDMAVAVGVAQRVGWAVGRRWPRKHTARGDSLVVFVPDAAARNA